MADDTDAMTAGRTDTERHTDDVAANELIEGDRISKGLVARAPGQLGDSIRPSPPEADGDAPTTQVVAISAIRMMDDSHSALLVDPETETIVRAGRLDPSQAWTQSEADWTVRDVGTRAVVEDVHELTLVDSDDPVEDGREYAQGWVDIVVGDMAAGHFDFGDEMHLNGSTLTLKDYDGREAIVSISLEN